MDLHSQYKDALENINASSDLHNRIQSIPDNEPGNGAVDSRRKKIRTYVLHFTVLAALFIVIISVSYILRSNRTDRPANATGEETWLMKLWGSEYQSKLDFLTQDGQFSAVVSKLIPIMNNHGFYEYAMLAYGIDENSTIHTSWEDGLLSPTYNDDPDGVALRKHYDFVTEDMTVTEIDLSAVGNVTAKREILINHVSDEIKEKYELKDEQIALLESPREELHLFIDGKEYESGRDIHNTRLLPRTFDDQIVHILTCTPGDEIYILTVAFYDDTPDIHAYKPEFAYFPNDIMEGIEIKRNPGSETVMSETVTPTPTEEELLK